MSGPTLLQIVAAALVASACGGEEAPRAPQRHIVEIRGFEYHPAALQVAPGDTVVWVNRDAVPHTVTSAGDRWDSGAMSAGDQWMQTVSDTGTTTYICAFHPTMTGQIQTN